MSARTASRHSPIPRWAGAVGTLAAIGLAIFLVRGQFAGFTFRGLVHAILATSPGALALASLCAAASYAALAATEWFALRVLSQPRPAARLGPLSLAANAITNSTGFGLATGTVLRARLYQPLGLSLKTVAALVALSSAANVLSGFATMGLCLLAFVAVPASSRPLAGWAAALIGVALIGAALLGYGTVRLGRKRRAATSDRLGIGTRAVALLVGMGDWVFSGLALFVLHRLHLADLPEFLLVFTAGSVLGSVVGAPAALGVLDAFILRFHRHGFAVHETAAALILYRLVYFAAPLCIAVTGLALAAARRITRPKAADREAKGRA